jgi:hypothetical protein
MGVRVGHPERVLAAAGDVGRLAALGERAAPDPRELDVVFDDEYAHAGSPARPR